MNAAVIFLAVVIAVAGVAAALYYSRRAREAEARQLESEARAMDWLAAEAMLRR